MLKPRSLLFAAAGAAAAWFLDPENGTRRRHVVRDKAFKYVRRGGSEAVRREDYAAGVAKGAVYEATPSRGDGEAAERLNDPALARKVETEIFRSADAPKGKVSVNVEDGIVYLRGEVAKQDAIDRLVEQAGRVDGVRDVENLLHTPGTPAPHKDESKTASS